MNLSSYDFKVYSKKGTEIFEISDFDFSDIEIKGEYEEIEYLYLPYPQEDLMSGISIHKFLIELIEKVHQYAKVRLIIPSTANQSEIRLLFISSNINISKIEFLTFNLEEIWLRDSMPTFGKKKTTGEHIAIKMHFNMWARNDKDAETCVNRENEEIMKLILQLPEISYVIVSNYCHDGGARQFNGKGTCMLCEHYERKRNPEFKKELTEELFKKLFGVTNFIWIPYPCVYDDSDFVDNIKVDEGENEGEKIHTVLATDGHIDGFAVFANSTTIIHTTPDYLEIDDITKENTRRLRANLEVLRNSVDQDGNKFKIVGISSEVQITEKIHPSNNLIKKFSSMDDDLVDKYIKDNQSIFIPRLCSYINYLMMKGLVVNNFIFKNGLDPEIKKSDDECFKVLSEVYCGQEIFMIDAEAINWGGGSLHCLCAHQPK